MNYNALKMALQSSQKYFIAYDCYYVCINGINIKYTTFVIMDGYLIFSDSSIMAICKIALDNIESVTSVSNELIKEF